MMGQVAFADARNGWYAAAGLAPGSGGTNLARTLFTTHVTHDGGRTWDEVIHVDGPDAAARAGLSPLGRWGSVQPTTARGAWLQWYGDGVPPSFYFTLDSGRHWQPAAVEHPDGGWPTGIQYAWSGTATHPAGQAAVGLNLLEPMQTSNQYTLRSSVLLRSLDGGQTWSTSTMPANAQVQFVYILDRTRWWMLSDKNLQFSSDAGRSWTYTPGQLPTGFTFRSVRFFDRTHAVGAGGPSEMPYVQGGGNLFRTADGVHWTAIKPPTV